MAVFLTLMFSPFPQVVNGQSTGQQSNLENKTSQLAQPNAASARRLREYNANSIRQDVPIQQPCCRCFQSPFSPQHICEQHQGAAQKRVQQANYQEEIYPQTILSGAAATTGQRGQYAANDRSATGQPPFVHEFNSMESNQPTRKLASERVVELAAENEYLRASIEEQMRINKQLEQELKEARQSIATANIVIANTGDKIDEIYQVLALRNQQIEVMQQMIREHETDTASRLQRLTGSIKHALESRPTGTSPTPQSPSNVRTLQQGQVPSQAEEIVPIESPGAVPFAPPRAIEQNAPPLTPEPESHAPKVEPFARFDDRPIDQVQITPASDMQRDPQPNQSRRIIFVGDQQERE
jgi:hypothetical protein